jgi:hypothetical protein
MVLICSSVHGDGASEQHSFPLGDRRRFYELLKLWNKLSVIHTIEDEVGTLFREMEHHTHDESLHDTTTNTKSQNLPGVNHVMMIQDSSIRTE